MSSTSRLLDRRVMNSEAPVCVSHWWPVSDSHAVGGPHGWSVDLSKHQS